MRRTTVLVAVLVIVLGAAAPGQADEPSSLSLEAVVWAETNPPAGSPGLSPTRRTLGASAVQFIEVDAVIDCDPLDGTRELVLTDLVTAHGLTFDSDDDVSDGFGTVEPTDAGRAFVDFLAIEVREDGSLTAANVDVRVLGGTFHRLGALVEVDMHLDVRVERDPDNRRGTGDEELQCAATDHEVKALLVTTPDLDADLFGGFFLNGTARSSSPGSQNTVRETCHLVSELTLPTLPEDNVVCAYG